MLQHVLQWVDTMALAGDSSDNVPGVAGIGGKGAVRIMAAADSLDQLIAKLPELSNNMTGAVLQSHDPSSCDRKLQTGLPLIEVLLA